MRSGPVPDSAPVIDLKFIPDQSNARQRSDKMVGQEKARKFQTISASLFILCGGLSAVSIALMGMWVFSRMDPTGMMAPKIEMENASISTAASEDVAQLKKQLVLTKTALEEKSRELKAVKAESNREALAAEIDETDSASVEGVPGDAEHCAEAPALPVFEAVAIALFYWRIADDNCSASVNAVHWRSQVAPPR